MLIPIMLDLNLNQLTKLMEFNDVTILKIMKTQITDLLVTK